jgi:hypothetical protein
VKVAMKVISISRPMMASPAARRAQRCHALWRRLAVVRMH